MYIIYLNGNVIHNPQTDDINYKLLKAELEEEENKAGSLSIQATDDYIYTCDSELQSYSSEVLKGVITVFDVFYNESTNQFVENYIWSGRINSNINIDFYNQVSFTVDGALSILGDTIQMSAKYENYTIEEFLTALLNNHNYDQNGNQKVKDCQRFYLGTVTVDDGRNDRYTEFETTIKCIEDLIADNGGHLRIRPYDKFGLDGYYLDYLADYEGDSDNLVNQYINFGYNLLDFAKSYSIENFYTVLLPLGKENEQGEKLTIESVNSGSPYLIDSTLLASTIWSEKMIENSDIETASSLKTWAENIMSTEQPSIQNLSIEVSAIDLHTLDSNLKQFTLLDLVRVISTPHSYNGTLPITKMQRNLLDPTQDKITLGQVTSNTLSSLFYNK